MVGSSGKLKTVLIGDSERHKILLGINGQLETFEAEKDAKTPEEIEEFKKGWNINLDDFKVIDVKTKYAIEQTDVSLDSDLPFDERIWRIKSLRVLIDDDN